MESGIHLSSILFCFLGKSQQNRNSVLLEIGYFFGSTKKIVFVGVLLTIGNEYLTKQKQNYGFVIVLLNCKERPNPVQIVVGAKCP
jgi:hypothetical protein